MEITLYPELRTHNGSIIELTIVNLPLERVPQIGEHVVIDNDYLHKEEGYMEIGEVHFKVTAVSACWYPAPKPEDDEQYFRVFAYVDRAAYEVDTAFVPAWENFVRWTEKNRL